MPLFRRKSSVKKLNTTTIKVKSNKKSMKTMISLQKELYIELERKNKILDELINVKKRRYSVLSNKYNRLNKYMNK